MSRLFEPLVTTPPQYRQRLTPGRKGNNDLDQNFGLRSQALTALRSTGLPLRIATRQDKKHAVRFGFQVITVESDGGVIEITASPSTLQKIQDAVEPASS